MAKNLDLDVGQPEEVAKVLLAASDAYYISATELEKGWQDKRAGKPWRQIAKILEKTAVKISKIELYRK